MLVELIKDLHLTAGYVVRDAKLIFIGSVNWDLYVDSKGSVWSIPKPDACPSTKHSWYGDKYHLLKLMRESGGECHLGEVTEHGLELLNGLHHRILPDGYFLTFNQ